MRISLDANILFSAAKTDGAMRALLGLLRAAGHECWADGYVLEEARRNLAAKAPDGLRGLDAVVAEIQVAETRRADAGQGFSVKLPEKDRPVLAAAVRLRCEALVTATAAISVRCTARRWPASPFIRRARWPKRCSRSSLGGWARRCCSSSASHLTPLGTNSAF